MRHKIVDGSGKETSREKRKRTTEWGIVGEKKVNERNRKRGRENGR